MPVAGDDERFRSAKSSDDEHIIRVMEGATALDLTKPLLREHEPTPKPTFQHPFYQNHTMWSQLGVPEMADYLSDLNDMRHQYY